MLIPNLEEAFVQNQIIEDDHTILTVDEDKYADFRDLYIDILSGEDEKAIDDYIKLVEKIIRKSYEYKQYIFTLKTRFDLHKCVFFKNIDFSDVKKVSMEMHHYPLTLYDIVYLVLMKRIDEFNDDNCNVKKYNKILNPFSIAKEVMKKHYEGKVGIVPLSVTPHELYHKGKLFIPLTKDYVFGNFYDFFDEYEVMDYENYKSKYEFIVNKTNEILDGETEVSLEKLKIHKVYIKMKNNSKLEKIIKEEKKE